MSVRNVRQAELAAAALLIFFAGTARAGVVSASLWFDSVNIAPAFIHTKKARTFVDQMGIFSSSFLKACGKLYIAFITVFPLLLGNDIQPEPLCIGEPFLQACTPAGGLAVGMPGFNQIIGIFHDVCAVARTHQGGWGWCRTCVKQKRLATLFKRCT